MKRTGGRGQPQTPTISEFEGDDEDAVVTEGPPVDLASLPDLLTRHQSLGERSTGSLHRTPMPTDLLSTSGSWGRLYAHRSTTPTIQENKHDR